MRKLCVVLASLFCFNVAAAETITVNVVDFSFAPQVLDIKQGDTVRWVNLDSTAHTILGTFGGSAALNQGDDFEFTFTQAGVFDYICKERPNMTGTVRVSIYNDPAAKPKVENEVPVLEMKDVKPIATTDEENLLGFDDLFADLEVLQEDGETASPFEEINEIPETPSSTVITNQISAPEPESTAKAQSSNFSTAPQNTTTVTNSTLPTAGAPGWLVGAIVLGALFLFVGLGGVRR